MPLAQETFLAVISFEELERLSQSAPALHGKLVVSALFVDPLCRRRSFTRLMFSMQHLFAMASIRKLRTMIPSSELLFSLSASRVVILHLNCLIAGTSSSAPTATASAAPSQQPGAGAGAGAAPASSGSAGPSPAPTPLPGQSAQGYVPPALLLLQEQLSHHVAVCLQRWRGGQGWQGRED